MRSRRKSFTAGSLASLLVLVGSLTGTAASAQAATDGQQVAFDLKYGYCPTYGPATNVTIVGSNQNGRTSVWHYGNGVFPNGAYVANWWWRGNIRVYWRDAKNGLYYSTGAFVPQWDDKSFEMWNDIVTIDCHGSLRGVETKVIEPAPPLGIWACGGWRDGAGLKEEVYFRGYDEYSSQTAFSYGIAGDGSAPAIVTWKGAVPIC
jgi:hypothetical protein